MSEGPEEALLFLQGKWVTRRTGSKVWGFWWKALGEDPQKKRPRTEGLGKGPL